MRGKAKELSTFRTKPGITPAYAGKSQAGSLYHKHTGDHPRLCGEKQQTTKTATISQGSPPPMRGKAGVAAAFVAFNRITPAYAGKSPRFTGNQ